MPESQLLQPPIRAVKLPLFPAMTSLREVMDYAESRLPIVDKNELVSILGRYHNTLLKEMHS